MKIAIIGGVAAGTSAAAKARRVNKEAEIVLFERGNDISYAGCGLPYYISGVTADRDKVVILTPEEFIEKYRVDVRTGHEVTEILPAEKKLKFRKLTEDGSENPEKKDSLHSEYSYDKLVIATGASPVMPPIKGINLKGIFSLREVSDADKIKQTLAEEEVKQVAIIGGGVTGLEMAESFSKQGLETTVIEKLPHILPPFSREKSSIVENHLKEKGVNLITGDGVQEFKAGNDSTRVERVITESGKEIKTDLVLVSIGVRPNVELARQAGIKLGPNGAIKVNEKMETSLPDIYAAGDCAGSTNLITGKPIWFPLGSTANKQGRIAGENVAGGSNYHQGVVKTGIYKIFELTVARTGLSEKEAEEEGFEPLVVDIAAPSHAGYYPGKEKLLLRGVFDRKTGRLLGAEAVGKKGADKRIDVLSTAIYSKLTAHDLFQLDLAYAPPYSTPKDPVAVLGMVAEGKLG